MKHIAKADEPAGFADWKQENIPLGMGYSELHSDVKNELYNAIIDEQGWICCYCERRIEQENSHIEHYCPQKGQNACPNRGLDYQNLHASCQKSLKPGEPHHCGTLKGGWFDEELLISPLDPGCEARFRFSLDGAIHPRNPQDDAAKTTISKLGLDIDKLRALRKAALMALEDLPPVELRQFLGYKPNGRFQEFHTTIEQLLA